MLGHRGPEVCGPPDRKALCIHAVYTAGGSGGSVFPTVLGGLQKGRGGEKLSRIEGTQTTGLRFAVALQTLNVSALNFHICKWKIVTESSLMVFVKITEANRHKALGRALKKKKKGSCSHCIRITPSS